MWRATFPLSGHGFVFINRRRTQLKCLYFDTGGYCVWSKRLEQGRFGIRRAARSPAVSLSRTEFEALIEGLDVGVKNNENVGIRALQRCWIGYNNNLKLIRNQAFSPTVPAP